MIKQQPQIRVIDTESEYFGDTFTVQEIHYDMMPETQIVVNKHSYSPLDVSAVQELTPLSHDGTRIGVGDTISANVPNEGDKIIDWYEAHDGVIWLVTNDITNITKEDITDHTPLTEMKKEENKPYQPEKETWEYEPRKDCILCDLEERGGMVHSNVHFSHHDELEKEDNDKPTIERIDRPDPYDRHSDNMVSLDVPEVAAVLIEMFEQQTEILEALADAGLINLSEN